MSTDEIIPIIKDELVENIKFRLETAQVISDLLRKKNILHFNRSVEETITNEVECFVRSNLRNLLLEIMGERPSGTFSSEEAEILKAMVAKIKASVGG